MTDDIYSHLNNCNFTDSYQNLAEAKVLHFQGFSPLSKATKIDICQLVTQLNKKKSMHSINKIYLMYHAENKNIEINAVGISNPKKLQGYIHLYIPLITASVARIIKLNKGISCWRIILFTDNVTKSKIREYINKTFPKASNNVSYIVVGDDNINYPMWFRFHLIKFSMRLLAKHYAPNTEVYCIDSDYIPSSKLNNLSPFLNNADVVFTTNLESFPLWQINEGVYCLKTNKAAVTFLDYCSFIYEFLYHDNIVLNSWKNPRIWRGGQAALMLSTFKFNEIYQTQENTVLNTTIRNIPICIRRTSGAQLNNAPCELFNLKYWGLDLAKCYHFTGNHKYNPLITEFINYCKNADCI